MAGVLVGGAFLSSFLNVLFEKLASPQVANFIRGKKIDPKLLERMKTTLTVVRAVLDDAEKKQIRDSNVNNWLNDLKDAVYVADDLLDEISTKAATQKEVTNPFSRFFNIQDREMATKLEDIVERLESILTLKDSLNLKEISVDNLFYRNPSTSLQGGKHVFGREEDKKAIIKLLLDDNIGGEEVPVISIVGMGGLGKTTLAQLVYNDAENLKFDFKAWTCVSEEFDIMRVTKIITQAVTGGSCNLDDLNLLHMHLQGKLKDKKYFIVLDDVWIEDYVNWDLLMRPFQRGVRGSKILVTTRSEKVASVVQSAQTYNLKKLSSDDCWSVFANHACFSSGSSANSTVLEKIGREIVEKCKGLPLAAQSLGGILRSKHDVKDWDNLLKSDIWKLSEHESKIIPSLRVSYHYLPPNLKRCFVYCSLFSKDYEFQKNDLILLWMAEDLLSSPSKGKTLEEVGYEYFDDLVARSFLQRSNNSEWESFVMHDLLHDLATFLGGEFYFRSEQLGEESKISSKTRHLACTISSGLLENTNMFETVKFLRTFFPSSVLNNETGLLLLMSKLKQLRVFSLPRILDLHEFDALPDSVCELIHLRYLDLSRSWITKLPQSLCNLYNLQTLKLGSCRTLTVLPNGMGNLTNLLYLDISTTSITELPESLCELYNLQTLKLSDCERLTMLPSQMQNLVNLRHLDIDRTPLKEMPKGMGKLTRLQNLGSYIVGLHEENGIQELGGLSNLQGLFLIQNLENVSNGSQALEAKIMDKKYINELELIWSPIDCCADSQTEKDILCNLQPHRDLQHLQIIGYKGTCFPDWVGSSSYQNMTELILSSCKNCWILPSLGQLPSLKTLEILNMDALVTIDSSFYGNTTDSSMLTAFPSLESLTFSNMPCWEVWSPIEPYAFPKLNYLYISSCPKLRVWPTHLHDLKQLAISGCPKLRDWPSHLHVLKKLTISKSLVSITCFQLETSPNFESLTLEDCQNLESLSVSPNCFLPKMRSLLISQCPNFISFPEEEFHAPIMTNFYVSNCHKLKSLPQQMNTLLPKLKKLFISNCPDIESFPEGGMPPSLRSIYITNCEKLLNSPAWPSMNMLTNVVFEGPCDGIKSFPKEGFLPSSLTSLIIYGFSSLETLDCKGLLHLTSLQELVIQRCWKLEKIAGEKLPVSLTLLYLRQCPLLEQQCSLKDPQVWPKISHLSLSGPRFDGSYRW